MPRRAAAIALLCLAMGAWANDVPNVLDRYAKVYTKDAMISEKEDVLAALVKTEKADALNPILFCAGVSKARVEDLSKQAEKEAAKLEPAKAAFEEAYKKFDPLAVWRTTP